MHEIRTRDFRLEGAPAETAGLHPFSCFSMFVEAVDVRTPADEPAALNLPYVGPFRDRRRLAALWALTAGEGAEDDQRLKLAVQPCAPGSLAAKRDC